MRERKRDAGRERGAGGRQARAARLALDTGTRANSTRSPLPIAPAGLVRKRAVTLRPDLGNWRHRRSHRFVQVESAARGAFAAIICENFNSPAAGTRECSRGEEEYGFDWLLQSPTGETFVPLLGLLETRENR